MTKYFCDRCGKEIESLDSVFIEVIDINLDFFHLCKDCYDELIRWRKAKGKDHNADWVNVVRCAECRWRPEYGTDHNGKISHAPEHLRFPTDENMEEVCPCSIGDWYYSWMPADDFFCKKGERKKDVSDEFIK